MRHAIHVLALAMLVPLAAQAAAPAAPAASPTVAPAPGKIAFDRWCAECHAAGVGHPGAQQLERLRGAKLALLEARNDLAPEFIRYVVRHGQNAMPPYRPSEISDTQLDQIAQYLGRNQPAPGKRRR
jgi:mono/diheme cytochrome c family protein